MKPRKVLDSDEILRRFADLGSGKVLPIAARIVRQGDHVWFETQPAATREVPSEVDEDPTTSAADASGP